MPKKNPLKKTKPLVSDVVEHFVSIQGEGPRQGMLAYFIRFKKCNMKCPFCDTMIRIGSNEAIDLDLQKVKNVMNDRNIRYLVVTGGEPGIYLEELEIIMNYFKDFIIGIETNGTNLHEVINLQNKVGVKHFEIYWSPKVFSIDQYVYFTNYFEQKILPLLKENDKTKLFLKIVISDDILYESLIAYFIKHLPHTRIYLMPQGRSATELLLNNPKVLDLIFKYNVNLSSRLHILGLVS